MEIYVHPLLIIIILNRFEETNYEFIPWLIPLISKRNFICEWL